MSILLLLVSSGGDQTKRPRIPGFGFRGLEAADEELYSYVGGLQAGLPGRYCTSVVAVRTRMPPLRAVP